ncbi:hypothetical protein AWC38_SpisGene9546 [Stylophora pistillata]|uniref:Uncharacterized protein n=1 Tax=Stylophora pistillata TaxID=50429 RepID=A0A2B4S9M0_STYPI|nr:hypothetical protein AWC38_SpisGene9546 [Stylophora pistillata]
MIASRSVQPANFSSEDPAEDQDNVSKPLLKVVDEIYSPALKVMKLFGLYLGDTSLKRLAHPSGYSRQPNILASIYGCVIIVGFWFNVVVGIFAIFCGDDMYTFILFSLWCVLIALNATLCPFVLCVPFADARKSRFGYFLMKLSAIRITASLEKLVNLPPGDKFVSLISVLIFLLLAACTLAIIMVFGSKVNEQIHRFQKDLETFAVSKDEEVKLVMFMLELQGEPKGLSVGGLAVINKSMSLTFTVADVTVSNRCRNETVICASVAFKFK